MKTATPTVPETPAPEKPNMWRTVVALGYVRKVRDRLGKIIQTELPDLEYQVSVCCGHMKREQNHTRCQCKVQYCPCR